MHFKQALVAAVLAAIMSAFSVYNSAPGDRNGETAVTALTDKNLELLPIDGGAVGPESVAFDVNGDGPYTGVSDGRILKWAGAQHGWIEYGSSSQQSLEKCRGSHDPNLEPACGRPLGLKFNSDTGELFVADAYYGLLAISSGGHTTRLVAAHAENVPFQFTNSLDIDSMSGVVYFTDSSTEFRRRDFISAAIAGDSTGRLMKYDPRSNSVEVLLRNLSLPNGVALSEDSSYLVLAESTASRILKYWLGSSSLEVMAQIPGFPDNVKRSPRGGYWVAIHSKRSRAVDLVLALPIAIRRILMKVPTELQMLAPSLLNKFQRRQILAVRINEKGETVEVLQNHDKSKRRLSLISEVTEKNHTLWVGSVLVPHLGLVSF